MICANCNKEIEDTYFKCLDNYIQVNYFEFEDETDNIFCSQDCFCKALMLTEIERGMTAEECVEKIGKPLVDGFIAGLETTTTRLFADGKVIYEETEEVIK